MFSRASAIKPRSRSPTPTPPRKRQRLSSPTFDQGFDDLTQEEFAAFDAIEASLSQGVLLKTMKSAADGLPLIKGRDKVPCEPSSSQIAQPSATDHNPVDDVDNPFTSGFRAASKTTVPTFARASALATSIPSEDRSRYHSRSPSPDQPPHEPNHDDWFGPQAAALPTSFSTVFVKLSTKKQIAGEIIPSAESLAKAKAKFSAWETEDAALDGSSGSNENDAPSIDLGTLEKLGGFASASHLSTKSPTKRPALGTVSNLVTTPSTPIPAPRRPASTTGVTNSRLSNLSHRPTAFKSPVMHTPSGPVTASPLNPHRPPTSIGFQPSSRLATVSYVPSSPSQTTAGTSSFQAPHPTTPASTLKMRPSKFVTPFKAGLPRNIPDMPRMTPTPARSSTARAPHPIVSRPVRREKFFELGPPTDRKTLLSSGLQPQQYDRDDLDSYGVDVAMLNQITPITAQFYSFHDPSSTSQISGPSRSLGPPAALAELERRGCTLVTNAWIDNHWCLILWKLAGMVALDPEKEAIPDQQRWCWNEVIRQLLYRYERELNSGVRPPLRKIANQDAPAQLPMCLCISNITWSPGGVTEDGLPIEPHPELELTDGWYRLRAQVDQPMARAVRKGVIRVGRKLGIAAARLDTEKKEASEVLEAYNSTKLVLSGNSSQLMPWHAKLGFINGRCLSTLHGLNPDGGLVGALDFVIVKMYPIAYLEFKEDDDGNKYREGPRAEAEEMKIQDQWNRRRELEASKLHEELDKKYSRYENYIGRMEQKAGRFKVPEGDPPREIESLFDRLEYADTANGALSRLTPMQAGYLAQYTKQQIDSGREAMSEEIGQELQKICPPREVKSFRVLVTQDARTQRRPANRTAQLTVWDVLSLALDEDSSGGNFVVGQRYVATNLLPQQQSSWMGCEPGSEIYLSTRRDTRWTKVRTVLR